jgi:aconitate hydratase
VKVILAKSFARIHETNLKKQGILALTLLLLPIMIYMEGDIISVIGLTSFSEGKNLIIELIHKDGSKHSFEAKHTYNSVQIEWFKAGSALNLIAKESNK